MLPPPPTLHDRYRIRAPLGAGSQGDVWAIEDQVLGTPRVLKRVPLAGDAHRLARREAALLRHLLLPGVVRLHDEWTDGQSWNLVLERIDGAPFPGAVDPLDAARSLCGTLAQVHRLGVVHRDLKPSNVLVDRDGHAVVLDFGLAHQQEANTPDAAGTLWYVAPEVLAGRPVTPAADLYAVGVMLLDALVGRREPRRPWTLATERLEHVDELGGAIGDLVRACLDLDPEQRPSATQLVALLTGAHEPAPLTLAPDGPFRHAGRELAPLLQGADAAERFASWTASGFGRIEDGAWAFQPIEVQRIRRQYLDLEARTWEAWLDWAAGSVLVWERRSTAFGVVSWVLADRRAADDDAGAGRALEVLVALALHHEDREMIEAAQLACTGVDPHPAFHTELLRTAIEARFLRRFEQCALPPLPRDAPHWIASAHKLVWTWVNRQDPTRLRAELQAAMPDRPEDRALHLRWLGLACYAVGDYSCAFRCFEQRRELPVPLSPADYANAASALLELGELDRAQELAEQALDALQVIWSPGWEAHLTWLARHIRYRSGAHLTAAPELVDAAEGLDLPVAAQLALNEAAVAWRNGDHELSAQLARRAEERFRQRHRHRAAALAASFRAWLTGTPIAIDDDSRAQPDDITMQTRAFTLAANRRIDATEVEAVIASPPDTWSQRLDLLSTREALALAGGEALR